MDPEMVYRHRLNIAELTKNEQDFYLMGIVRALLMDPSDRGAKRQRKRSSYSYQGKKVCLFAFLYLENISLYSMKKIRSHVMTNGVVAIQHGNSHKIPHNAFPLDLYKRVENFLKVHLGDKQQSSKSIILDQPLSKVYQAYKDFDVDSEQHMGYSTFRTFFKKQFPHVRLANPISKPPCTVGLHQQYNVYEEHVVQFVDGEIICKTDDSMY